MYTWKNHDRGFPKFDKILKNVRDLTNNKS